MNLTAESSSALPPPSACWAASSITPAGTIRHRGWLPAAGFVDFSAVSSAALAALDTLIPRLLPGGYRKGNEWLCRNPTRNDTRPGSFKVNMKTGVWSDFATGDKGGDIIDLLVYLKRKSKLEAARELGDMLNVPLNKRSTSLTGNVRSMPARKPTAIAATPTQSRIAPTSFPPRTKSDKDGRPFFVVAGDEGPPVGNNEQRRHIYRQGGVPVHIKIVLDTKDMFNVYRVTDADGKTGWQYRKPDGFEAVPYFAGTDPLEADQPIYWPEGEKDAETLARLGLPAFTFGGTGDGLPDGSSAYVTSLAVVVLADNDVGGRKHAEAKVAAIYDVAASVRVVHFPDVPEGKDVSDWIEAGHTIDELAKRVEDTEY